MRDERWKMKVNLVDTWLHSLRNCKLTCISLACTSIESWKFNPHCGSCFRHRLCFRCSGACSAAPCQAKNKNRLLGKISQCLRFRYRLRTDFVCLFATFREQLLHFRAVCTNFAISFTPTGFVGGRWHNRKGVYLTLCLWLYRTSQLLNCRQKQSNGECLMGMFYTFFLCESWWLV